MRSLKSGLVAIAMAGLFGTAVVVGCSADGAGVGIDTEGTPTEPNAGTGTGLPPKGPDGLPPPDAGKDSGKKDSGPKPEAGIDAGPPPPVEGTACPTLDALAQKPCGACGKAETACLDDGTGKGKWSSYGACIGELPGGCVPGTTVQEDCGDCGKVTKTCTQYCAYTSSACTGQPANHCKPGTIDYTTAGCAASTYRKRSCGDTCTYNSFSMTCEEPNNPNKMTISPTVGVVVTRQWTLHAAHVGKQVTEACGPNAVVSADATFPYVAVEVANPTAQTATIQIYHSGSSAALDTLIWVYSKNLPPTDATLGMCDFGSADRCISGDPCGNEPDDSPLFWAGIDNVIIPPNGKILVYSAGYTTNTLGKFNLNLKTTKLM